LQSWSFVEGFAGKFFFDRIINGRNFIDDLIPNTPDRDPVTERALINNLNLLRDPEPF